MSIIWLLLGAFIGWSFPQPMWAKILQAKVIEMVKSFLTKPQ